MSFAADFVVCVVLSSFTFVLFAQDESPIAYLHSQVINVSQSVPVLADVVVPLADGAIVTATVPITVNVDMQGRLSGIVSDSVQILQEPEIVLGDIVTTKTIDNGNKPTAITDTFSLTDRVIYVVAEVNFIEKGSVVFARWYHEGEPFEDSSEITADKDYSATYLEFHLELVGDLIKEGNYGVEIFGNGTSIKRVDFVVAAYKP